MTKKELKDIILKTLEKEGGAAGLKALAKAAKTSKKDLEKALDDMSGVKQHQDGDYISTPINEAELFNQKRYYDNMCGCHYKNRRGEIISNIQPCPCSETLGTAMSGGPRKPMSGKPMRIREVKEIIEVMLDEKKKKKKDRCHRKADSVYGTKTSAYKSGAIVKCRKGMIWKVGGKKKK